MNNFTDKITNTLITQDELMKVLSSIDSKSSALENIRSKVIIDAFFVQTDRILKVYNVLLTRCFYPADWENSNVVPFMASQMGKLLINWVYQ